MKTQSSQQNQIPQSLKPHQKANSGSFESQQGTTTKSTREASNNSIENKANDVIENLCQGFLLFVGIYFLLMIPYLWDMIKDFKSRGIDVHLSEYIIVIPCAIFNHLTFLLFRHQVSKLLVPYLPKDIVREGENKEQRRMRLGNLLYGVVYYTISFFTLLYLEWGTDGVPKRMGGEFDATEVMAQWPYVMNRTVRFYYLFTLSHHIERAYYEVIYQSHAKTFYTMIFHHVLTIMLVFISSISLHMKFGIAILLTHDVNDISMCGCRLLRETRYQTATSVVFLISVLSWFYTRIWVYLTEVVGGLFHVVFNIKSYLQNHYFVHCFFPPALLLLSVLNTFWAFQMIRVIFWRFFKKQLQLPFEDSKGKEKRAE